MTLIFCIDERCGIAFNGRRQSRDTAVCEDILRSINGTRLETSAYSAPLFYEMADVAIVDSPSDVGAYFCELCDPEPLIGRSDTVILYKWNRIYPSDVKFTVSLSHLGFTLCESVDISGRSHEKITKEIYRK